MAFTFKLNKLKFLLFGKTPQDVCKEYNEEYRAKYEESVDNRYIKGSIFSKWEKERYIFKDKSPAEIMGLEMGKHNIKREVNALPAQNPHTENPYIEVDENGDILLEQFELNYIKEKYNSENYEISEESSEYGNYIIVKDSNTLKTIVIYCSYDNKYASSRDIIIYDTAGDEKYDISIRKDFMRSLLSKNKEKKHTLYMVNERFPEEHRSMNRLYDEDGKLKSERTCIYGNNIKEIIYHDEEAYKSVDEDGKTIQIFLVNELAECLQNKNFWGRIKEPEKLERLMSKINKDNIYEILVTYKRKTGRSLYYDIEKGTNGWEFFGRKRDLRDDSIRHLDQMEKEFTFNVDPGARECLTEYTAEMLIANPNNTKFLKKIEDWQAKDFLNKYKEIVEKNPNKNISPNLFEAIMQDEKTDLDERVDNALMIIKKCVYINDPEILKELTDVGFNIVMEHCKSNCEDIKDHMILNRNNLRILLIDLLRYANRNEVTEPPEVSMPNGEIDLDFEQGKTGDCWLLAGCISIFKKPEGKKILESLIDVNKETGDVTVRLKGVDKEYVITYDEIKKATYLAGGDGDIRAIELAFNKYQHERAIESNSLYQVDINGNSVEYIYNVLLGNSERIDRYSPDINEIFNDPNKFYEIGTSGFDIETGKWLSYTDDLKDAMTDEEGNPVDFVTGHAYAIIKADENYVYLVNPWDSSKILKITPQKLESLFVDVGIGWVE